jgi:hypothetical protein
LAKPAYFLDREEEQHQDDTQYRDAHPKFAEQSGHALTFVRESCGVKEIHRQPGYLRAFDDETRAQTTMERLRKLLI